MPYDPRRPHHERYIFEPRDYDPALLKRVEKDALTLCRALGYDLNTVEFAVENGVPYAIDFMNPVPDADLHSIGRVSFEWIVDRVAKLAVKKAKASESYDPQLNWCSFLTPPVRKEGVIHAAAGRTMKKGAAKRTKKTVTQRAGGRK